MSTPEEEINNKIKVMNYMLFGDKDGYILGEIIKNIEKELE